MADAHLASKCMRVLNQHVGCVPSDDDFVEIVYDHVYSYYKDKVDAFPGAREFMEEVAASGIPYVMATGTRRREVRAARHRVRTLCRKPDSRSDGEEVGDEPDGCASVENPSGAREIEQKSEETLYGQASGVRGEWL